MRQFVTLLLVSGYTLFFVPTIHAQQGSSDAIALAEKVIEAMGGQDAWNDTRTLRWNFFNSRSWWWDKWTGDVRMESLRDDLRIGMNVHSKEGYVFMHGQVQTDRDSLGKYLDSGYKMWINDSYWLVMPFKLLDPGVVLRHLGTQMANDSTSCHVLELTFDNVGVTPQNKYHVYIHPESHLVLQWDYYRNASDPEPRFSSIWGDYHRFGEILLSLQRGEQNLTGVAVHGEMPPVLFRNVAQPATALIE